MLENKFSQNLDKLSFTNVSNSPRFSDCTPISDSNYSKISAVSDFEIISPAKSPITLSQNTIFCPTGINEVALASTVQINGMDLMQWEQKQMAARKNRANTVTVLIEPYRSISTGSDVVIQEKRSVPVQNKLKTNSLPEMPTLSSSINHISAAKPIKKIATPNKNKGRRSIDMIDDSVDAWKNMQVVDRMYRKKINKVKNETVLPDHIEQIVSRYDLALSPNTNSREELLFWYSIVSQWNTVRDAPFLKKVWLRDGIPPCFRGLIWPLCLTGNVELSEDSYSTFQSRNVLSNKLSNGPIRRKSIERDIARMKEDFHHVVLAEDQWNVILSDVQDLLEAFCNHSPEVSYIQGMSYVATLLLVYLESSSAFNCFCNIMHSRLMSAFLTCNTPSVQMRFQIFDYLLAYNFPIIFKRLEKLCITPYSYLFEWYVTLFSKLLPVTIAARICDHWLYSGEMAIIIFGLAIISLLSEFIETMDSPDVIALLGGIKVGYYEWDEEILMKSMKSIQVPSWIYNCTDEKGEIVQSLKVAYSKYSKK